ncbi:hypothetical protein ACLOJK_027039 [Asimina triloba]
MTQARQDCQQSSFFHVKSSVSYLLKSFGITDLFGASSSCAVCGKDIVSTISDLIFLSPSSDGIQEGWAFHSPPLGEQETHLSTRAKRLADSIRGPLRNPLQLSKRCRMEIVTC